MHSSTEPQGEPQDEGPKVEGQMAYSMLVGSLGFRLTQPESKTQSNFKMHNVAGSSGRLAIEGMG